MPDTNVTNPDPEGTSKSPEEVERERLEALEAAPKAPEVLKTPEQVAATTVEKMGRQVDETIQAARSRWRELRASSPEGPDVQALQEQTSADLGRVHEDMETLRDQKADEVRRAASGVTAPLRAAQALQRVRIPHVGEQPPKAPPEAPKAVESKGAVPEQPTYEQYTRALRQVEELVRQEEAIEREGRKEKREAPAYDPEVNRLNRELVLADALRALERGESLSEEQKYPLVGTLESRGWYKLLDTVKEGDELAAFIVPGGEMFSIKHFNDNLFGMQKTDRILDLRRHLLRTNVEAAGLERVADSFKDEFYRLPGETAANPEAMREVNAKLGKVVEDVRRDMTAYIVELAGEEEADADADRKKNLSVFLDALIGPDAHAAFDAMKAEIAAVKRVYQRVSQKLNEASEAYRQASEQGNTDAARDAHIQIQYEAMQQQEAERRVSDVHRRLLTEVVEPALTNPDHGYRVTMGMSTVGAAPKENDYTHIERAACESMKGAMLARETAEGRRDFTEGDAAFIIEEARRLREDIGTRELIDEGNNAYKLFEPRPDGHTVLNPDVIRAVRKGKFIPADDPEQRDLLVKVQDYMKVLNTFDIIKPFTHEEMQGEAIHGTTQHVQEQVGTIRTLSTKIKQSKVLDEAERASVSNLLRQDGKDRSCTSSMEFTSRALEIPNCTYVSLDVLDLGVGLYQEFEELSQRVERGELTFDEAQLIAGDTTSKKMRLFRERVTEIYGGLTGEKPLMYVGGDEIMLALDSAKVTDAFIMELRQMDVRPEAERTQKKESSIRVIKTVVAESERSSDISDTEQVKREHLEARKRAERGTEIAKDIEAHILTIKRRIHSLPPDERSARLGSLGELNMEDFAVKQREGEAGAFELVAQGPDGKPIRPDLEEILAKLEGMSEGLKRRVAELRKDLLQELQPDYPLLHERNIGIILSRKYREPPDIFEQTLSHYR